MSRRIPAYVNPFRAILHGSQCATTKGILSFERGSLQTILHRVKMQAKLYRTVRGLLPNHPTMG